MSFSCLSTFFSSDLTLMFKASLFSVSILTFSLFSFNSVCFLILSINFLLILIIFLTKDFIATNLLKEPLASPILMAFALTLPFVSISAVLKGYFAGKQNMVPHATSNILEQIVRLIIIVTILPTFR